jgi:hypothetical protein
VKTNVALLAVVTAVAVGAAVKVNYPRIAVGMAPIKKTLTARSANAVAADSLFWRTLHGADYEGVSGAIEVLTQAYTATPNDALTAAHLGWLHFWRVSERARLDSIPATITEHLVLARKYFAEAVKLDATDARYLGFLASAMVAEGTIDQDERLTRAGYFKLLEAVDAWPEFNLFTIGYVLSQLPEDSPQFRRAVEWQWENLDACVSGRIDRADPGYAKYMSSATTHGPKRACWNTWIAPHNFEGFFLNMGDMLVKSGDWQTARRVYANAKLSSTYEQWKFRDILEARVRDAEMNVAVFRAARTHRTGTLMVHSSFACMACHQN